MKIWISLMVGFLVAVAPETSKERQVGDTGANHVAELDDIRKIKGCEKGACQPIEDGYCKQVEDGFCNDPVIVFGLKKEQQSPIILVNCAIGTVIAIQLPESDSLKGEPILGNAAIFQAVKQPDVNQVLVWPTVPKGVKLSPDELTNERSNIQLNLASGISVLVQLRISSFTSAVQRIVLRFPEREKEIDERERQKQELRKQVEQEFKQAKDNLEAEAHRREIEGMARDVLKRVNCESLHGREMVDLLVVRADQICQIGDHLYVRFTVQNRARDLFAVGSVEVLGIERDKQKPMDSVVVWENETPMLRFDQKAEGAAIVPVTEESSSAEYAIRVTESAGKKRVVLLKGIEF